MKNKIEINCCLCDADLDLEVELPGDWTTRYESIMSDVGFCPKHALVAEFADSQCPGCVGGWGDCDLFKAFAYSNGRTIGELEFEQIRTGICPYRTNGTFFFDTATGRGERVHIENQAPANAGALLEKAIREYISEYPVEE